MQFTGRQVQSAAVTQPDPGDLIEHFRLSENVTGVRHEDTRVFLPPPSTFELCDWDGRLEGDDVAAWRLARRALAAPRASAEPRNGRQYTWLPDPAADQMAVTVVPVVAADPVAGPTRERWALTPWPDYPGKTVVLVTHEWDIAQHCKRVIRFKDGRLLSDEMVRNPLDAEEELKKIPDIADAEVTV